MKSVGNCALSEILTCWEVGSKKWSRYFCNSLGTFIAFYIPAVYLARKKEDDENDILYSEVILPE